MWKSFSFSKGGLIEGNQPGVGEVPANQPVGRESRASHPQEEPRIRVLIENTLYEFHGPQSPTPPEIQIVFFHGLERGDSSRAYLETWKSSDGSTLWPKDWLGEEFKNARILSVSYDSSTKKGPTMGRLDLHCTAENLIQDLTSDGVGLVTHGSCPIVMVGKDLGSLVILEVCIHARANARAGARASDTFLNNLRGLFFYCPPTMGVLEFSKAFDGDLAQKLRWGDLEVSRLLSEFKELKEEKGRWKVTVMNAAHPARGREPISNVPESSARAMADAYYTAKEDIVSICRPTSDRSSSYIKLKNVVSECLASKGQVHLVEGLPILPVGLMERALEAEKKLRGTCVLGIFGMGGMGKTTLAKQLFNNISWGFEYTCFAEDVTSVPLVSSLEDHVKGRFYRLGKSIHSIEWSEFEGKKILLVMDNIDSEEQLRFIPSLRRMKEGSVIVLTTRNQEVLKYFEEFISHEVDFLEPTDAERLFCSKAFKHGRIPESMSTHAEEVIAKCDGLPLTLEVLGAYLCNKIDSEVWNETIRRLGNADTIGGSSRDNDRVWSKLEVSYETLAEGEKEMFIDIAVFLVGESLETVLAACSTGHGNPKTRWDNLVSRCLVKGEVAIHRNVDGEEVSIEKVWMHEHLQDLGHKLSSRTSVVLHGGSGSFTAPRISRNVEVVRLSEQDDTLRVRKNARIIPRYYRLKNLTFNLRKAHFQRVRCLDLRSVSFKGFPHALASNLRFLRWINRNSIPFPIPFELAKMEKLAVLELDRFELGQALQFPKALRILKLSRITGLDCLPEDLGSLSSLKVLELLNLNFAELPESLGCLSSLVTLKVTLCENLTKLPESLGCLSSLVTLKVTRCENLDKLPESFGNLRSLQYLGIGSPSQPLPDNVKLQTLPDSFVHLAALKTIRIGAPDLESLPDSFELLTCLQNLRLHADKLRALPKNFGRVKALVKLHLRSRVLSSLPDSFPLLKTLQKLEIRSLELHKLPDDFGQLHALSKLKLDTPKLVSLPDSIGEISSLEQWTLAASSLESLPHSIGRLTSLKTWTLEASSLMRLPESIGELYSLKEWTLYASSLECLPDSIGGLTSLKKWTLGARNLMRLPDSIGELSALEKWTLDARSLQSLPHSIGGLISLERSAPETNTLTQVPDSIGDLSPREEWTFKPITLGLPETRGGMRSLEQWDLCEEGSCDLLGSLGQLPSLQRLEWSVDDSWGCLSSLSTVEPLLSLQRIVINFGAKPEKYWKFSKRFQNISGSPIELTLNGTYSVRLPDEMENLTAVRDLALRGFEDEALPAELGSLTSLHQLAIYDFCCLRCLPEELGSLSSLQELIIVGCLGLESLPEELGGLSSLRKLTICGCDELRQLPKSLGSRKGHKRRREEGTDDDSGGSSTGKEMVLAIAGCKGLAHKTLESWGWTRITNTVMLEGDYYELELKQKFPVTYSPIFYRRR